MPNQLLTGEPTPDHDPEWERVLERARLEELRDQKRALALSNPYGLPLIALQYFFRLVGRSILIAVLLVVAGRVLWAVDGRYVAFKPASWKNSHGFYRDRMWNRFQSQYQPVGMRRKELTHLLGQPDELDSPQDPTVIYYLDDAPDASEDYQESKRPRNSVEFKFRNDVVVSYREMPVTLP